VKISDNKTALDAQRRSDMNIAKVGTHNCSLDRLPAANPVAGALGVPAKVALNPQALPHKVLHLTDKIRRALYPQVQTPRNPIKLPFDKLAQVSLNPQPLPPGPPDPDDAVTSIRLAREQAIAKAEASVSRATRFDKLAEVSLNPQPLPPGPPEADDAVTSIRLAREQAIAKAEASVSLTTPISILSRQAVRF
jgi:hypothetical protein